MSSGEVLLLNGRPFAPKEFLMPQGAPQPSPGEHETSPRPGGTPPSGRDDAQPGPEPNGALFHTLLKAGFAPGVAYTAERRIQTMTSEIAGDRVQPVLAEIRQVREQIRENMVTKADLAATETRIVKWMFGALMAQGAFIIAVIKLLG